jgi:hypothetical protein
LGLFFQSDRVGLVALEWVAQLVGLAGLARFGVSPDAVGEPPPSVAG